MNQNVSEVFYELRDNQNKLLTAASIEIDVNKYIRRLKEAVYNKNKKEPILQQCNPTHLHVFPPNTTDIHSVQSVKPEATIQEVLNLGSSSSTGNHRIILKASPPAMPVTQDKLREPTFDTFLNYLRSSGIDVDKRILQKIKYNKFLFLQITEAMLNAADAVDIYTHASHMLGSSTKREIRDRNPELFINELFDVEQYSGAIFYTGLFKTKPVVLKYHLKQETALFEYDVYKNITSANREHLVKIELVQIELATRSKAFPHHTFLVMNQYANSLHIYPRDRTLSETIGRAQSSVFLGLRAIHSAGFCHLDVKPGNLFVDAAGDWFLGDYDAAMTIYTSSNDESSNNNQAFVQRTTPTFLPKEFALLHNENQLRAHPAVDYGMLVCTMLYMLFPEMLSSPSLSEMRTMVDKLNVPSGNDLYNSLNGSLNLANEYPYTNSANRYFIHSIISINNVKTDRMYDAQIPV